MSKFACVQRYHLRANVPKRGEVCYTYYLFRDHYDKRAPQEPYGAVGPLGGTARHASESGYNESYDRSRLGTLGSE